MVEKLAQLLNKRRSMISDYQSIAHNLGEKAMKEFQKNSITKSAATALAGLEEEEQDALIEKGITSYKEIQDYKKKKDPSVVQENQEKVKAQKSEVQNSETLWRNKQEEKTNLRKSKTETCPNCGTRVCEQFNKHYCGQCGKEIQW